MGSSSVSDLYNVDVSTSNGAAEIEFTAYTELSKIWKYGMPTMLVFGLIGNILSFVVFSSKGMNQGLTSFLFRVLAVFDTLSLIEAVGYIAPNLGYDLIAQSGLACGIVISFLDMTRTVSAWILVGISIERCIGVILPFRVTEICTITRGKIYLFFLVCIFSIIYGVQIPTMMVVRYYEPAMGRITAFCNYLQDESDMAYYNAFIYPWVNLTCFCLFPFLILLLTNINIIFHLVKASRNRQNLSETRSSSSAVSLTVMLVCICCFFIIATAPWCVYTVLYRMFPESGYTWSMMVLFNTSLLLRVANHAANFLLYCLSGSRFREALWKLMSCPNLIETVRHSSQQSTGSGRSHNQTNETDLPK